MAYEMLTIQVYHFHMSFAILMPLQGIRGRGDWGTGVEVTVVSGVEAAKGRGHLLPLNTTYMETIIVRSVRFLVCLHLMDDFLTYVDKFRLQVSVFFGCSSWLG